MASRTITIKKSQFIDEPTCKSCKHFSPNDPNDGIGFCKRYPPVVLIHSDGDVESALPVVDDTDDCGEFSRRVN